MEPEFLPCPCCRTVTLAEVPPCAEDHGGQCSDRACTVCGTALTVGGQLMWGSAVSEAPALNAPRSALHTRSAA